MCFPQIFHDPVPQNFTKMNQNSISISCSAQTPKNRRKNMTTRPGFGLGVKIMVSVRNRFWPPPSKAYRATAILTNVIENLVLLFPPNKHAFTAKAAWADFHCFLQFVHVPPPLANPSKTLFFTVCLQCFPAKTGDLHVFGHKVGPKH